MINEGSEHTLRKSAKELHTDFGKDSQASLSDAKVFVTFGDQPTLRLVDGSYYLIDPE